MKISDMAFMYIVTILTKLFFREKITTIYFINIIVGTLFFIKLSCNLIKGNKTYKIFTWLEQYAFWIYATHGIALAVMIKLSVKIMPMTRGWLLVHYFIVTSLCIILLLGTGIIFRKIFPKIFSILTGGR
jgi:hypothetical protein